MSTCEIVHADLCESTPPLLREWYALVDEDAGGVTAYFHALVTAARAVVAVASPGPEADALRVALDAYRAPAGW